MIGSLQGKIATRRPDGIIVDVGGVGYQVSVPLSVLSGLPDEGQPVFLHVYTHVREDSIQLFGFSSENEKQLFISMLGISGIGPKMALNILSGISYDSLLSTIEKEDVDMLCRIPGLGKKTAHRLILEMRGKLPAPAEARDRTFDDTLSALVNLGYKKSLAEQHLRKVYQQGATDIEMLLRETLKLLIPREGPKAKG